MRDMIARGWANEPALRPSCLDFLKVFPKEPAEEDTEGTNSKWLKECLEHLRKKAEEEQNEQFHKVQQKAEIERAEAQMRVDERDDPPQLAQLRRELRNNLQQRERLDNLFAEFQRCEQELLDNTIFAYTAAGSGLLPKDVGDRVRVILSQTSIPVLVCGPNNSGKSLVINTILGEQLCDVYDGRCTARITTLHYSAAPAVELHDCHHNLTASQQGDVASVINACWELQKRPEDFKTWEEHKQRFEDWASHEIRCAVPNKLLKCHLDVIDTPGLGENTVCYLETVSPYLLPILSVIQGLDRERKMDVAGQGTADLICLWRAKLQCRGM
jgi:ATPase subunit of ABC transporter with duplicated ATPase domains